MYPMYSGFIPALMLSSGILFFLILILSIKNVIIRKKVLIPILSYFFIFFFLVWFYPSIKKGKFFAIGSEIRAYELLFDAPIRYFTVYFEDKLKNIPLGTTGFQVDGQTIVVTSGEEYRNFHQKYPDANGYKTTDYLYQSTYINYGIANRTLLQIILPFLIIYLSFFTKLNVFERSFWENYMLWVYILIFFLFFLQHLWFY
ncbi:hypothetical protein OAJ56_01385 [Flavobacteriales bacterium]|nr:hypothetical protein [Flavobacteriales bacterium]